MNKKTLIAALAIVGLIILAALITKENKKEPITITESSSLRELTIDDKIREAELILIGETEQVHWVNSSEPDFKKGKIYLLFLKKDTGPTKNVDSGDYISVNSNTAVYEIVNGKAISVNDEWILEDLIAYIEQSLSNAPNLSTPAVVPAETTTPAP